MSSAITFAKDPSAKGVGGRPSRTMPPTCSIAPTKARQRAHPRTWSQGAALRQACLPRTPRARRRRGVCDAYASWQKGGVENANGRLRRWLPRQIDIDKVSDEEMQDIILTANLTPRKCLGFKTPFQAILKEFGKDDQIRFS